MTRARRRRVLMFAYSTPPCTCYPTASERAFGLARYLPDWGWEPTLVTRDIHAGGCRCRPPDGLGRDENTVHETVSEVEGVRVLRTELSPSWMARVHAAANKERRSAITRGAALAFRKLATFGMLSSEGKDDWVRQAIGEGRRLLEDWPADAVWTTSRPFRSTQIGYFFQETYGLPWVADLRDAVSWTPSGDFKWMLRRFSNRRFFSPLRMASAVVGVSPEEADRDVRALRRAIDVIPSGFDTEEWRRLRAAVVPQNDNGRRTRRILYAGRIYPQLRDPAVFFQGLKTFLENGKAEAKPSIIVHYLGPDGGVFRDAAERFGVGRNVLDEGVVSVDQARQRMVQSDALLLLTDTGGRSGIPGGKLYEYLAAGRPIIAVPGRDSYVQTLLNRAGAGVLASTPDEVVSALDEYTKHSSVVAPLEGINEHSWKSRAGALAQVLERSLHGAAA